MNRRRRDEIRARFDERRKEENEALRLADEVPQLRKLRITLHEYREGGTQPLVNYVRHIVVERAPALFRIPCGDADCEHGGYDLTRTVMRELRSAATGFTGEDVCRGDRHHARCGRKLCYELSAEYAEA
jgi:hypothetical protein